ncbi:uncharacterized protein TNCV_3460461 [Trichonephila clavipes]|nr:uncharacterized protein TNCV_3460461 [Trichonephila clavipes]
MIPDMLNWRQIWRSSMPRKGNKHAETVLRHPFRMKSSIVLLKNGSWEPLHEWQHMCLQGVMDIPLGCHVQFPRAQYLSKRRRLWVGVKGSTRNRCRYPKCPSARPLRMVREDTRAPSEGAIYAWMAADEAVGSTRAFLTMWRSSRRLVCRRHLLSLGFG